MPLEFSVAVDSCRDETQCVGNVCSVSSARVTEFDFLTENSIVDVKRVQSPFDFHLSAIFITLRPICDISM